MAKRSVVLDVDHPAGDWTLKVRLAAVNGRVECVGLSIDPASADGEWRVLTTEDLGRIRLQTIVNDLRIDAALELAQLVGLRGPQTLGRLKEAGLGPLAVSQRGPGRPRRSRADLERAAAIYREARKQPTKAVAEAMHLNYSTATKVVAQCREEGLLDPTTPGRRS